MSPEEREAYFAAYLSETLSASEQQAFNERLQQDAEFSADFDEFREVTDFISSLGAGNDMRLIIEEEKLKRRTIRRRITYAVAACIAIILAFTFIHQTQKTDLKGEYFEPYRDIISKRAVQGTYDQAMLAYNRLAYQEAITLLSEITPKTDTLRFYRGISFIAEEEYNAALDDFEQIQETSTFYFHKLWYQGLTFVLLNEPDSAKYYLERVPVDKFNYTPARALIQSLER